MKDILLVRRCLAVEASKEKIWEVLTSAEHTPKYMFNCKVETTWEKGSSIEWKGNYQGYEAHQVGEVLEYIEGERIRYTSFDKGFGLEDVPENYIHMKYELVEQERACELIIEMSNFNGDADRCKHAALGMDQVVMPQLETLLKSL